MKKIICCWILIISSLFINNSVVSASPPGQYPFYSNALLPFTASASNHTLLLSEGGTLTAWGQNDYGQCGAEPCDFIYEANYIDFNMSAKIIQVAAGEDFSLALDSEGTVWGWGNNSENQLGIRQGTDQYYPSQYTQPQKIMSNAKCISAGDGFGVYVDNAGALYVTGIRSGYRKIDFGYEAYNEKIKMVSASGENIVAVSENNFIFYFRYGQTPQIIKEFIDRDIKYICAGDDFFSCIVEDDNEVMVYSMGNNSKGQLGIEGIDSSEEPVLTLSFPVNENHDYSLTGMRYGMILNIYGSGQYSNILNQSYIWGTNTKGISYSIPTETTTDVLMLTSGNSHMVFYKMNPGTLGLNASIILSGDNAKGNLLSDNKTFIENEIFLIESDRPTETIYPQEYEEAEYYSYTLNFIELTTNEKPDDYEYFNYIDSRHFQAKGGRYIAEVGSYAVRPAYHALVLKSDYITFNNTLCSSYMHIWNFSDSRFEFTEINSDPIEIDDAGYVDTLLALNPMIAKRNNVFVDENTAIYNERPYPINDETKTGLYVYGLPDGVKADKVTIGKPPGVLDIHITGEIKSLDHDMHPTVCYVFSTDSDKIGQSLKDCDRSKVLIVEKTLSKAFKARPRATETPKTAKGGGSSSYTITFDSNDGSPVAKQTVSRNRTVNIPDNPIKEGYIFSGWYTDKELTSAYDFEAKVTKSITLYAKWYEIPDNSESQIVLTIGEKTVTVFGEMKENDVAPLIRNDRAMLPTRFVAESLGAEVEWFESEQIVRITKDETEILINIGSDKAKVNGKVVSLDSPAFIENDRTYTPIRFISERLGAKVDWDENAYIVTITKLNSF